MTPDRPERKNPRLRGWDYGAGGTYFVTFCTSAHRPVLSSIRRGDPCGRPPLVLTPLGECVAEAIALTGVRVEHQVIMPNHVHLLLTLERAATRAAPTGGRDAGRHKDCPRRRPNASSRKDCPHRSRDAGGRKGCPHRQWAAGRRRAGTACRRRKIPVRPSGRRAGTGGRPPLAAGLLRPYCPQ